MPIRIILEFDTPEEAAHLVAQLPDLAHALPSGPPAPLPDRQAQRTRELNRPMRYEEYQRNGGRRTFLGWCHQGEPSTPADEIDMTPGDQVKARALAVVCRTAKLIDLDSKN